MLGCSSAPASSPETPTENFKRWGVDLFPGGISLVKTPEAEAYNLRV